MYQTHQVHTLNNNQLDDLKNPRQKDNKKWKSLVHRNQDKEDSSLKKDNKYESQYNLQKLEKNEIESEEERQKIDNMIDDEVAQKRKKEIIELDKKNKLKESSHKFHRQEAKQELTSIFNEHELKRAPSLFENYQSDIQRQLEFQMHSPDRINTKNDKEKQSPTKEKEQQKLGCVGNIKDETSAFRNSLFPKATNSKMRLMNLKRYFYLMFEDPMLTKEGRYVHLIIQFFILVSVTQIITDSCFYDDNKSTSYDIVSSGVENVVFVVFCLEFLIRLYVYNSFGEPYVSFLKNPLNVIDFISLLPFIIDIIILAASNYYSYKVGFLRVIRIVRLVRIVRIFKLSRYLKGLDTLQKSLKVSKRYFSFVCATLTVFVIFIATIIYYFEKGLSLSDEDFQELGLDRSAQITSIPQSMWFVLTTLATIGYGDKIPLSIPSKIIVGFVVLVSQSFVIGLPIAIVGFDFSNTYKEEKEQQKFNKYKEEGIQIQKGNDHKIKELQFMQQRLRKISKTNKLVRELSSRSSKMCYLITKDLVGLYVQVVLNEQREIQKRMENLKITGNQNWAQLQKFFGLSKIKMENIKVKQQLRSPMKKERFFNDKKTVSEDASTIHQQATQNNSDNQDFENQMGQMEGENVDSKIKNKFVRNNLKKLKTLLVSNANVDISSRNGTKIISPPENFQPHSNFKQFHPQNIFTSFRTQKSEEFIDFENQSKRITIIDSVPQSINSPISRQLSGRNKTQINQQEYIPPNHKRKTANRLSGVLHQVQQAQALQPHGDDIENMPNLQNQLEFLNEILMDLVSEESVILNQKQHDLDEYNETCSELDDENVRFFEIEKTERKKSKQKRIILEKKTNQPQQEKPDKLFNIIQQARNTVKSKTVIQEVTESNNETSEINNNNLKQSLNLTANSKGTPSYRFDFIDEEINKQIRTPLSGSKLLSADNKGKDIFFSSGSDLDQGNFDSSIRLKQKLSDNTNRGLNSSVKLRYSNQRTPSMDNISQRKKTQIKHESYQNLFENRLSPGETMIKINKKKSPMLVRAKTMFVKNINFAKSRIEECSEEEEENVNSATSKQNNLQKNIQIQQLSPIQNKEQLQPNKLALKKSNSLNFLLFHDRQDKKDFNPTDQDNYQNQTKFDLRSELGYSPEIYRSSKLGDLKSEFAFSPEKITSIVNHFKLEQNSQQSISPDVRKNRLQQNNYTAIKLQKVNQPQKLSLNTQIDQASGQVESQQSLERIESVDDSTQQQQSEEIHSNHQKQNNQELNSNQNQSVQSSDQIGVNLEEEIEQQKDKYNFQNIILDFKQKSSFNYSQKQGSTRDIEQ